MPVAGLLLTGGAARRLGVDKAALTREGESLLDRGARVLSAVCDQMLVVGPSSETLPSVQEEPRGEGPLAAVVAGTAELRDRGHRGRVLVLAVDLPFVDLPLLGWLASHPAATSVVPRVDGIPQSLCARYSPAALDSAEVLVATGAHSMRALLAAIDVTYVDEGDWGAVTDARAFHDVDTPEDAARAGLQTPG